MEVFPPLKMLADYNILELVHLESTNLFMPGSPSRFHNSCSCMADGVNTSEKNLSQRGRGHQCLLSSFAVQDYPKRMKNWRTTVRLRAPDNFLRVVCY